MTELTTAKRERLHDSSFAYIDNAGERHLPINDEAHVRNAIARFDQTDFESAAAKQTAAKHIIAAATLPVAGTLDILMRLELRGLIVQLPGKCFSRTAAARQTH